MGINKQNANIQHFVSFIQKIIPMDQSQIDAFASRAKGRVFKKKELFIQEGDVCNHLLFIHQGIFRYFVLHEGADFTKDFAVDSQNPFCTAFKSFMRREPSHIFIEALEQSTVCVWNEREVSSFFDVHPLWIKFAKKMIESLYYRKEKRELLLLKYCPQERYAQFICDFPELIQRIPQYLIAGYLAITPESLSRIRKRVNNP